jgi:hypothetical protein
LPAGGLFTLKDLPLTLLERHIEDGNDGKQTEQAEHPLPELIGGHICDGTETEQKRFLSLFITESK